MGYRGKEKKNSNLPEQNLVGVRPVGVGGVKEGDPGTERGLDEGHAVLVGHRGVIDAGEAHAPETDLRHLQHTKLTHQEEARPFSVAQRLGAGDAGDGIRRSAIGLVTSRP